MVYSSSGCRCTKNKLGGNWETITLRKPQNWGCGTNHLQSTFLCAFWRRSQEVNSWLFGCWGGSRFIWQYKESQNSGRLKGRCDQGVVCHEVKSKSTSLYDRSLHMHWSWLTDLQKLWSQQLNIMVTVTKYLSFHLFYIAPLLLHLSGR